MKVLRFNAIAVLALFAFPLLNPQAMAQMRPDCVADPTKPGVCFLESEPPIDVWLVCEEGFFAWGNVGAGENDFYRINPDGTIFAHFSDRDLFALYCTPEVLSMGLCYAGSSEAFYGVLDIQANGLFFSPGIGGCPFLIQSRGQVTRPSDGKALWVAPKLRAVPDPNFICKIQTCQILATGNENAEGDGK